MNQGGKSINISHTRDGCENEKSGEGGSAMDFTPLKYSSAKSITVYYHPCFVFLAILER